MKKSPTILLVVLVACCLSFGSYTYLEIRNDKPEVNLQGNVMIESSELSKAGATLVVRRAFGALQRLLVK